MNYPDLNDLAFFGRNKSYGSYYLRKKYFKYLLISLLLGAFLFLTMVFTPFFIYYFEGSDQNIDMNMIYAVEYDFIQSPENDLSALASLAAPPDETPQPPVVVDSVPEKKEKKEEIKPEEEKNDEEKADSTADGKDRSLQGNGTGDDTGIYTTLDVFPKYPGGDLSRQKFLQNNISFPETAHKTRLHGKVTVVFVVEADGSVSNVQVTKGIEASYDAEVVRVTKLMPRWDPGRRSGKPVRVMYQMSVTF